MSLTGFRWGGRWTSGAIGEKVRIELWRNETRASVLLASTKNDGEQKVVIPENASKGEGYSIRVNSQNNPDLFTVTKGSFAIR